jgi:predicted enzyme related to lactoylglutathione lyase
MTSPINAAMKGAAMLRGLTTVSFWADDLEAAKAWYSELLGIEPYFVVAGGYAEFRIGDYQHELGLIDRRFAPEGAPREPGGAVIYWHVDDLHGSYERLLAMGASSYQEPIKRGEGFVTAAVVDPFGNVLGIMYNQHYLDMLGAQKND